MKSLWNEADAAQFADDPLRLRVYSSRLLGSDPSLVLHGGGNTSVKATVTDLFGDKVDVLYVKGSGWDLGTIEAAGFAPVRMDLLLRMAELEQLSDGDMVKYQRTAMLDPGAPNPSVEAILHATIPFQYVDHSHADAICTICNTPDGEARIRELYGPDIFFVPYVMPGFELARTVYEMTRNVDWNQLGGMLLMSHGLFTFADSARESYEQHIALVNDAEEYVATRAKIFVPRAVDEPVEKLTALACLRRAVSKSFGAPLLAVADAGAEAVHFANLANVDDVATRGLLTPDHVIRTGRVPLVLSGDPNMEPAQIEEDVAHFAQAYRTYFERHSDGSLTMLDAAPRWAVWRSAGTVAFGPTVKAVNIINDIKRHTIRAIITAEALTRWHPLGEREIFDIEYWELEQAKLKSAGSAPPLQGKIALVTGAASGIGRACVEALHAQGAVVAALDIQPQVQAIYPQPGILGIVCDVTKDQELQQAVEETVRRFGGLDILIGNAGIFPTSQPIAQMGREQWERSLALNLTSHQRLLQFALPFLELGIEPAVVFVASKNVPAPGPGAAAYSAAKAGLTQLARVAALELGGAGIRVNVLHPNAVFDTAIWSPEMLQKRAESYGVTVDEYKTNNVLKVEITSRDVAALACAMVGPLFSKTTGAQLPIDGGNERVI